jgi:antitoxin (DNA-binding transcriptional repressor) of toxin-antitoxin stability system
MLAETIEIQDAQPRLKELVFQPYTGGEVLLTDGSTPLARLVSVLMLLLFLSACSAESQTETDSGDVANSKTEVIHYLPSVPEKSVEGECWESIALSWSPEAWRCSASNSIYDPCLFAEDNQTIVCDVPDPQLEFGIDLTAPLPEPRSLSAYQKGSPWRLELANDVVCEPLTGTLPPIQLEVSYGCSDQSLIIGELQTGATWFAEQIMIDDETRDEGGYLLPTAQDTVPILKVWLPSGSD